MPVRISKERHEYANRVYQAGDPVDVEPDHVSVLCLVGKIVPQEGDPGYAAPAGEYLHRAMTAVKRGPARKEDH
jgi:hypothetical protein